MHGGPGLGFSDSDKAFFDPEKFHVIFIDQRGCGRSVPKGKLEHNCTEDLIHDTRSVLDYLDIKRTVIFGGSWGATLAILFAAAYPEYVESMILRGFFSATKACTDIYLRGLIRDTHPALWEGVSKEIPQEYEGREAEYIFEAMIKKDDRSKDLARTWARYGLTLSRKIFADGEVDTIMENTVVDLDRIRIELNYALNRFFISEGFVYEQARKIKVPVSIVHGLHDYICPIEDARHLKECLVEGQLHVVDAGHSAAEKSIHDALMHQLDQL